jgi:hypothetical protein
MDNKSPMMILAFDPGGTTGVAAWCNDDEGDPVFDSEQLSWSEFVNNIDKYEFEPDDVIVAERYTITAQTLRKSRQTTALEVIGVLRYIAARAHIEFVLQSPADAKRYATDARLEKVGWLKRPLARNDHANDAARHMLLYLVSEQLIEAVR